MPNDKPFLDLLRAQLEDLPAQRSGMLRLARVLVGDPTVAAGRECPEWQELLPDYVEAELNGQPVRRQFPDLAAHLDLCSNCGQMYVELLETALAADAGLLPVPSPALALDFSFLPPIAPPVESVTDVQRVVLMLVTAMAQRLRPDLLSDLPAISPQFFHEAAGKEQHLRHSRQPAQALGYSGPELPPAFQWLLAAYVATLDLLHSLTDEQLARVLNPLQPSAELEKRSHSAAKKAGMRGEKAHQWAREYVNQLQAHATDLLELARRRAKDE